MREPLTLRLSLAAVERSDGILYLLKARAGSLRPELVSAFAFKNDERDFARALLRKRTSFWLFRTHQRRFCADFVVVDMASKSSDARRSFVIDLKLDAPLRLGGGGAGMAFTGSSEAIREIARDTGIVRTDAVAERVAGDSRAVLAYLLRR